MLPPQHRMSKDQPLSSENAMKSGKCLKLSQRPLKCRSTEVIASTLLECFQCSRHCPMCYTYWFRDSTVLLHRHFYRPVNQARRVNYFASNHIAIKWQRYDLKLLFFGIVIYGSFILLWKGNTILLGWFRLAQHLILLM